MQGLVATLLAFFCFGIAVGLKVSIVVAPYTLEGKDTIMACKFDLEGATFGAVKWEKDDNTFFKYSRRRNPPKEVFNVPGVNVDVDKSNITFVVLNGLTKESSGTYSCAVTTSGGGIQSRRVSAKMTTVGREPTPLIVATRRGFFAITTSNCSSPSWENAPPALSIGYHMDKNKIYYAASGGNIINQDYDPQTSSLGGALILTEESLVTSIAVDWLHNKLYFTDDYLDTVGMVNLDTEERVSLLDNSAGVVNPESLAVDPFQGYLFWGDNDESNKKIVASGLDGQTNRQIIVRSNIKRAILAVDLERRRLYFIGDKGLTSCKYDGSDMRLDFQHPALDNRVVSLSYYDNYIFWSRYDTSKSSSGLFFTDITSSDQTSQKVEELPIKSILDVKVFHKDMQKRSIKYKCDLIACSHDCALDNEGSAYCTCPSGHTLTAGNTVCKSDSQDKNCEMSETMVNDKPVCKGQVIFEDDFEKDSLDPNKWQHTVQISSDHEEEFAIFDKDPDNTFIKDGNLVIKPSLILNEFVTTGNISLIGCTSPKIHLCQKKAFSYSILPPVKSGLINTRQYFNFRYGTITIRAKMPKGDWLFPVFQLRATRDYYNPDYRSGVMCIAHVNGNRQLTCNGTESGNKVVAAGVSIGKMQKVTSHYVSKVSDKAWSDDFHIYKFTWAPDSLTFSVDDQLEMNILPPGKTLKEVLNVKDEVTGEGTIDNRISPLNEDFYLSIGLSVGGILAFPNDCSSTDQSLQCSGGVKPWKNDEVKRLLKFWQKKNCWSQTWNQQAALTVDYVRVKAL